MYTIPSQTIRENKSWLSSSLKRLFVLQQQSRFICFPSAYHDCVTFLTLPPASHTTHLRYELLPPQFPPKPVSYGASHTMRKVLIKQSTWWFMIHLAGSLQKLGAKLATHTFIHKHPSSSSSSREAKSTLILLPKAPAAAEKPLARGATLMSFQPSTWPFSTEHSPRLPSHAWWNFSKCWGYSFLTY